MKDNGKQFGTLLICIVSLMGGQSCDTEKNVEDPDQHFFVKYYGSDGDQHGVDMQALSDGSFLLLGNYSSSNFDTDVYLLRVSADGEVMWEKRFMPGNSNAKDLEPTADGNFVVLSDYQANLDDSTELKLLKISPEGTPLDSVIFGTPANDYGRSVTLLDDGGFIVTGTTEFTATYTLANSPDPDLGDIFNYRFDQNLNVDPQWGPVYHGFGSHLDVAVKTIERPGGFYVFGFTNSVITGDLNPNERKGLFYFERQSSGTTGDVFYPGNVVNVNDTEIQYVEEVPPALGTGFLIIGTSQNNVGISEIFLARLRSSLTFKNLQNDATLYNTVSLQRNIRGVAAASSVVGETGYLVLGNEIRGSNFSNIWISKIDQGGGVRWSSTFGSEAQNDTGAAVVQLPDGKIVILGTMELADNQSKMALIKLNAQGQLLK